jgi:hypothetical protein
MVFNKRGTAGTAGFHLAVEMVDTHSVMVFVRNRRHHPYDGRRERNYYVRYIYGLFLYFFLVFKSLIFKKIFSCV